MKEGFHEYVLKCISNKSTKIIFFTLFNIVLSLVLYISDIITLYDIS